ncbi:hypothetical protein [Fictibacillus barbaricus]|uniref:Uncharacterized protein n=1 Tax=Fictibacillus barbaricus TaxID=182136 RepID=A0ABS2Z785_9BACL|nr:hypothetical protein [Fictibacillus barbaricus]MBN3543854.1 hypothetical protein [Fictibacillus barbaricus]GGB71906.1 hypothetical protein GCM10007199_42620 [Fictibacillus barbaricus]
MFSKIHKYFRQQETNDKKYISVPESEINDELKVRIIELEKVGDEFSKVLQRKYAKAFESQGKQNLKIWVCRDIDGTEEEDLSSKRCLEKEYRSQIAIDFEGPKCDEDLYADTLELWYYIGGYFKGSGTLYNLSKNDLATDIEETLKVFLK